MQTIHGESTKSKTKISFIELVIVFGILAGAIAIVLIIGINEPPGDGSVYLMAL